MSESRLDIDSEFVNVAIETSSNTTESLSMKKALLLVAVVCMAIGSLVAKDPVGKIFSVKGKAYIAHLLQKKKVAEVG